MYGHPNITPYMGTSHSETIAINIYYVNIVNHPGQYICIYLYMCVQFHGSSGSTYTSPKQIMSVFLELILFIFLLLLLTYKQNHNLSLILTKFL